MVQLAQTDSEASTIDPSEVAKFNAAAHDWWNPHGEFRILHKLNPVRLEHLYRVIASRHPDAPLSKLQIIDVACGGGLVTEPLAARGATITGLDASEVAIETARTHAGARGLSIPYIQSSVEAHAKTHEATYDVVIALEIIEHVADVPAFLGALSTLLKTDGTLIISTLNRNIKSYLLGILAAERILRWVPEGTHDWHQFMKPSEIARHLREYHVEVTDVTGLSYRPLSGSWQLSDDTDVNYILTAEKQR